MFTKLARFLTRLYSIQLASPAYTQPEDWDDEMDGEWEAPQIDNPEFKGEWKAKKIDNPEYKGVWVHPRIPNPEFKDDNTLYSYPDFGRIGLDLWQVKSGSIFDDFLITDDEAVATARQTAFKTFQEEEATAKKAAEEKKKAEDDAKAAEEAAKKAEEGDDADADADADEVKDEL
jgi:calreticulin